MSSRYGESKSEGILKHFAIAFGLAVLCYVSFFSCDSYLRTNKGPWELTFKAEQDGTPNLVINQPSLGITNVTLRVIGESVLQSVETVKFTGPGIEVPFGEVVFFDTTYLPGTLTLDLFGHEVEMMGRTLVLNFKEKAWESGKVLDLDPSQKWRENAKTNQVERLP